MNDLSAAIGAAAGSLGAFAMAWRSAMARMQKLENNCVAKDLCAERHGALGERLGEIKRDNSRIFAELQKQGESIARILGMLKSMNGGCTACSQKEMEGEGVKNEGFTSAQARLEAPGGGPDLLDPGAGGRWACPCCGKGGAAPALVGVLARLAGELGEEPCLTSVYRCEKHNREVGGVPGSSHTKGLAADIACESSAGRYRLLAAILKLGIRRIGIYRSHIHVDVDGDRPQQVAWLSKAP